MHHFFIVSQMIAVSLILLVAIVACLAIQSRLDKKKSECSEQERALFREE